MRGLLRDLRERGRDVVRAGVRGRGDGCCLCDAGCDHALEDASAPYRPDAGCSYIDAETETDSCVSPETEAECRAAVAAAGLSEGYSNKPFAGSYGSGLGCHTYLSGAFVNSGFWSTSGDPTGEPSGSNYVRVCAASTAPTPRPSYTSSPTALPTGLPTALPTAAGPSTDSSAPIHNGSVCVLSQAAAVQLPPGSALPTPRLLQHKALLMCIYPHADEVKVCSPLSIRKSHRVWTSPLWLWSLK